MSKVQPKRTEPKRISCFTPDQQAYYAGLPPRQRAYVDARGRGNGKAESYRMAGYTTQKNAGQNAWILEHNDKRLAELIEVLDNARRAKEVLKAESQEAQRIKALAEQSAATSVLQKVEDDENGELARQIRFFRDIAEGKIRTIKKTVYTNAKGAKSTKIEYISDVDTRIKARKELDRLLGISAIQPLGQISAGGNVNIMIVDASKKDAVEDSRNNPAFMEMQDKTEELDGEVVIVSSNNGDNGQVINVVDADVDIIDEENEAIAKEIAGTKSADKEIFNATG